MKSVLIALFLIISCQLSFGEVAIIQDVDGWTNVRASPNVHSPIIDKVYENEVFWFYYHGDIQPVSEHEDWIQVYIPQNSYSLGNDESKYISGYMHVSRILPLGQLQQASINEFHFQYELSAFNSEGRIISKDQDQWITAIDGQSVWGTDGTLPRIQVDDIEVKIGTQKVSIDKAFYADIYECTNNFSTYKNGDTYFVSQWNSDGAGAYKVVWVFNKGALKQRFIHFIA